MSQPLFFQKIVPLDRDVHRNWRVSTASRFEFGRNANAVAVSAVEFRHLVREYPIVFVREEEAVFPIALLGIQRDENLYLDTEGNWMADYVPAYVRMYPFILSQPREGGGQTVCIDEAFAGFNQQEGERLFDEQGGQTDYLSKSIQFLTDYQNSRASTQLFGRQLKELDLLEPMTAKGELNGGKNFALTGFQVVRREKLRELEDETILRLFRNGALELIHLHLAALENFNRLATRASAKTPQRDTVEAKTD